MKWMGGKISAHVVRRYMKLNIHLVIMYTRHVLNVDEKWGGIMNNIGNNRVKN